MSENELRFIGVVRSEVTDRKAMPAWGAPARVEIYAGFEPALLQIEKHSHFWVFAWLMARPERDVLQVVPRGADPDAPKAMHGVFAVRAPSRPNPIGLTAARLTHRDGLVLSFDRLDFLDGTPVLDLKPYFNSRDHIFSAHNATLGKPRNPGELHDTLTQQAHNFCGTEPHADVAAAVEIIANYREQNCALGEPASWDITVPLDRPHLASALMGMTRVRPGRGLTFHASSDILINGVNVRP